LKPSCSVEYLGTKIPFRILKDTQISGINYSMNKINSNDEALIVQNSIGILL
jgi:hypothetical protein